MYSISEIRDIVAPIARRHGVERMTLFGSYARGDNTPSSDIDFRIDRGSVRGLQMAFLLTDLEDALKVKVDLLPTTALDDAFLSSIRGEEKLIYERN
ncbi:MAG: nucleotidyltransferase domain-containing protein [Clostridia bacterium]|nr:nucleotidyltransferase domain-containing protein [Clostridia bacterium]